MPSAKEKDAAWRRYKEVRSIAKVVQCTRSEMQRPTEANVQKHLREVEVLKRASKEYKQAGRLLGENTNIEKHRRG